MAGLFRSKRGFVQFLLPFLGLGSGTALVLILGSLFSVMLVFGGLYFFITSHLGQILGFLLFVFGSQSVFKNGGINDQNKWFVFGMMALALVLFFVPLDFIQNLKTATLLGGGGR